MANQTANDHAETYNIPGNTILRLTSPFVDHAFSVLHSAVIFRARGVLPGHLQWPKWVELVKS